jgi:hypothetical protein
MAQPRLPSCTARSHSRSAWLLRHRYLSHLVEDGAFAVEWLEMHNGFWADVKDVPLDTPVEAHYGARIASIAARPRDVLVKAKSSSPVLTAHAVKRRNGGVALILNKHPNQPYVDNVTIPDATIAATRIRYDFGRANFSLNSSWAASGPVRT